LLIISFRELFATQFSNRALRYIENRTVRNYFLIAGVHVFLRDLGVITLPLNRAALDGQNHTNKETKLLLEEK
jgi:hypothetical protein